MQLSLWQEEEQIPAGYIPVPPMGACIEVNEGWADGDTDPAQLARLARIILGESKTHKANNGQLIWFRIVATKVEGDHVRATLQRIEPLVRGKNDPDEDEEETA